MLLSLIVGINNRYVVFTATGLRVVEMIIGGNEKNVIK